MKILALETATRRCLVALRVDGRDFVEDVDAGNTHSQIVLPMVERILAQAAITYAQLDAVAFGAGPGSFTGVRIACACGQALALAHGKPCVPVGTLGAVAYTCGGNKALSSGKIFVLNDARMNEIYAAGYERSSDGMWREAIAPRVGPWQDMLPPDASWCVAGDAVAAQPALAVQLAAHHRCEVTFASGSGLLNAAEAAYRTGRLVAPADAQPLYVRDKVALTEAERAAAKAIASP